MAISKTDESCRTIYISNKLLDILKRLHIRQNKNKLKYGEFCIKNIFNERACDFIFTWENGSSIHPMYYLNFKKTLIKLILIRN